MTLDSRPGLISPGLDSPGYVPSAAPPASSVPVFYMHYSRLRRMAAIFILCGFSIVYETFRRF